MLEGKTEEVVKDKDEKTVTHQPTEPITSTPPLPLPYHHITNPKFKQALEAGPIKGPSRMEYVPYERKYTEYEKIERIEKVPVEKTIVQYKEVKKIDYVPKERTVTDYYMVEHQTVYVPKTIPETRIEYLPVEIKTERLEYVPVQRQVVHYPDKTSSRLKIFDKKSTSLDNLRNIENKLVESIVGGILVGQSQHASAGKTTNKVIPYRLSSIEERRESEGFSLKALQSLKKLSTQKNVVEQYGIDIVQESTKQMKENKENTPKRGIRSSLQASESSRISSQGSSMRSSRGIKVSKRKNDSSLSTLSTSSQRRPVSLRPKIVS